MIAFLLTGIDVRGGTHKQFLKLIDYTSSQNIDFCIITRNLDFDRTYPGFVKYKDKIKILNSFNQKFVLLRAINFFRYGFKLRRFLKDFDVVNIHDSGFELFLPFFIGKKVYWQINDLPKYFKVGVDLGRVSLMDRISNRYVLLFSSIITEFTVNVSKNRDRIQKHFHRDSHVIYCGIEPLDIERDILLSKDRFCVKKVNLLTSGVFFPYRNYETQINVVKCLLSRGIDVHLNIIGATIDKFYFEKISQLIVNSKLEDRVKICGQVDEKEFEILHNKSDIFIFVNVDQSWGLAVFEAMSCGIPVIVSNSVGAIEILEDNINSIIVEPYDSILITNKILDLMFDYEKYKRISEKSKVFCENFTWDNCYCSKMLNLMQK